jgi:hypothetical protein
MLLQVISAHVAMVLLDILPANSKTGIMAITNEVILRSSGAVDEYELCYYHQYLIEQLSTLKPQVEKGKFANGISSSEFFQQLKRQVLKRFDGSSLRGLMNLITIVFCSFFPG